MKIVWSQRALTDLREIRAVMRGGYADPEIVGAVMKAAESWLECHY